MDYDVIGYVLDQSHSRWCFAHEIQKLVGDLAPESYVNAGVPASSIS